MKKNVFVALLLILTTGLVFGGNLVHNTNQSADFIRMMNRNASTDLDATYFNPAGLTNLEDGVYFSLSNQTILQDREVKSSFALFGEEKTYLGTTFAPVFPNIYYVDKRGDFALSLGFMPIGGGGSANYDKGLPSFEYPVAGIPYALTEAGIPTTAYSMDMAFEGSSAYLGFQANVSYKMNDAISLSVGARYIQAKNTYVGHLKDISINPTYPDLGYTGNTVLATDFFTTLSGALAAGSDQAAAGAASATGAGDGLQPLVDAGAGDFSFDNLVAYGYMAQADVDAIAGGAVALGIPFDPAQNTPNNTQPAFYYAATTLTAMAAGYSAQAEENAANAVATADVEVDVVQTGSALAPVIGLYLTPVEGLGLSIRYEGQADMTLVNDTEIDGSGLFPDKGETPSDMPAMLATGLSYKLLPSFRIEGSYNIYFNKDVDWGGKEAYTDNGFEYGVGAEFALSNALTLSGGWLYANGNVQNLYNSDMSHSLPSNTIGFGGKYALSPRMGLSFGVSNTSYEEGTNDAEDETYMKTTLDVALGLDYAF